MSDNKYQVMPDMSEDEYQALVADIAEHGVIVPIEVDGDGNVLDGHHRLRACDELGITDYPKIVREGMTEDEKYEHALRLNTNRRHLTPDQMKELILNVLIRFPGKSNREIGRLVGVSHTTVYRYRKMFERSGQVEHVSTCEGSDGKTYPSKKPAAEKQLTVTDDPRLMAYKIIGIAEKANTLEVWKAARDVCQEMHQTYADLVALLEAKEAELRMAQ